MFTRSNGCPGCGCLPGRPPVTEAETESPLEPTEEEEDRCTPRQCICDAEQIVRITTDDQGCEVCTCVHTTAATVSTTTTIAPFTINVGDDVGAVAGDNDIEKAAGGSSKFDNAWVIGVSLFLVSAVGVGAVVYLRRTRVWRLDEDERRGHRTSSRADRPMPGEAFSRVNPVFGAAGDRNSVGSVVLLSDSSAPKRDSASFEAAPRRESTVIDLSASTSTLDALDMDSLGGSTTVDDRPLSGTAEVLPSQGLLADVQIRYNYGDSEAATQEQLAPAPSSTPSCDAVDC